MPNIHPVYVVLLPLLLLLLRFLLLPLITAPALPLSCPTNKLAYLPDTQHYILKVPLDHPNAQQACADCGTRLVAITATNHNLISNALQSANLGGINFWVAG